MKLKTMLAAASVALAAAAMMPQNAAAQGLSKSAREMLEATMNTYNQILADNPKDYQTLYRRAYGFYNQDSYGKALADVNAAIQNAPAKETGFLFDCHTLRAGIYERLHKYDMAIADYKKALTISPKDYGSRYQLANCEFEAEDYKAAKADYEALKRLNPRSQEAYFGLARVAVKEGDIATANKLMNEAVDINPTSAQSYMRQASVQRMMGNNTDAADSYAVALSLDRNVMPSALREMVALSATDYNAVMNGLQKAIDKNPNSGAYYYIRAMIAKSHFHYLAALTDFNTIVDRSLLNLPSIYTDMAECYYNLGDYATAISKADYAIGSSRDNREAYVVKALTKIAQGFPKSGEENARKALEKTPDFAPALMALALAQEAQKLYPEANVSMSKAIDADPARPLYYMERAWLLKNGLNLPDQAPAFYEDVVKLGYPADQVVSLKGFALLFLDRTAEADAWMENLTANVNDSDGEIAYYAACFWAQRGQADKALEFVASALKKGYASYYNWTLAVDGGVNVQPLRDDPRFKELLDRYSNIFK